MMSHTANMPESHKTVSTDLFVATDMNAQLLNGGQSDIMHDGKIYRRLSPDYFAWLRSRMQIAQTAYRNKRLSHPKWDALRQRFNYLQEQAIALFGTHTLKIACESLNISQYHPPKIHQTESVQRWLYPAHEHLRFSVDVPPDAIAKVDAIQKQAMDLGWTEAQLYQNQSLIRFPCGKAYGLVCFVGSDRQIMKVTSTAIEILHHPGRPREKTLRFHRSNALQPWITRTEEFNGN